MNNEVALRLISNLERERIAHDQTSWLRDHTDKIVVTDEDRWTCATTGCAAGFIFLSEAPSGSVFDRGSEGIFTSMNACDKYYNFLDDEGFFDRADVEVPVDISEWAGAILGLNYSQREFLFFSYGNTAETIDRIKFLMENPDYDSDGYDRDFEDWRDSR